MKEERKRKKERIMPSLVATKSASGRTTFVRMHSALTKRWIREICGITSKQPFPVLCLTEWEYIFEKVSHDLNIVTIAKGQEYSYLSPGSLIYPQSNESQ